ncbi:putative F-box protein At4g22660 [Lotus japonicus]|uniref:putative F-box protein At4g22660 n=1 Tax=Lotus japonicus TaxID=34305 RepID=UPI002588C816|nr:putative F-box protein At4g22660 [Lotus japonicus]
MGRGEQRNGGWSDIQQELLEEILRKLTLFDYLKCRRVCRSWRRIVNDAVATKGTCPPAPQLPFLMLLPPTLNINKPATLLDITQEGTSYTVAPPRTWKDVYVDRVYSVEGWMVFRKVHYHKNQDLVLFFNPVSGEEFELPPLTPFSRKNSSQIVSVKLVFYSAPNSSDFLVVVCATIFSDDENNRQQLAFCKVADKSWTLIPTYEYRATLFNKFVILDWKLYAMRAYILDTVTVFNLRDSNNITFERLVMLNSNAIPKEPHIERKDGDYYRTTESEIGMTRDGDELLLVLHRALFSDKGYLTKGFHIFKLDICGPRWIEVDDLGDRVLLVDETRIQVISTRKINFLGKLSGGNCVLFSNKYVFKHDLVVFSLKDKSVKPLSLHPSSHPRLQYSGCRCLWFMPSPW